MATLDKATPDKTLFLGALANRVKERVAQAPDHKHLDATGKDARWRLFETLTYLEQIAVVAAERGDGIPGQLEDEIVHREVFRALTDNRVAPPDSVTDLSNFINDLHGPASLAVLNIVAESWLETLFRHVGTWGVADEMFAAIAEEESRHVREAHASPNLPSPDDARPLVRELERLLFDIARDPQFMLPLVHFGGTARVAAMGAAQTRAHKAALDKLGLDSSPYTQEIARCGREFARDPEPTLLPLTPWQTTAFQAAVPPISASVDIPWEHGDDPSSIEARVVRAVSKALVERPELNRTVRHLHSEVYQPFVATIGVRRLHSRGLVATVYSRQPHRARPGDVAIDLHVKAQRLHAFPYDAPDYTGVAHLIPASRVAATVTCCSTQFSPGTVGWSSLVPLEGATISIVISPVFTKPTRGFLGWPRWRPHINLGLEVDHRCHDGEAFGNLIRGIEAALTE